jgi:predicted transcriptional regulator
VLTGDISTDDVNIRLYLAPMRKINEVNIAKYETKVENQRQKKINEMKLDKIAELAAMGYKQREIGEKLGLSQQIISYRLNLIKKTYPELLQTNLQTAQTNLQTVYKNTNDTNGTKTENFVEPVQTVYKDTNDTNNGNFVQNSVCKNPGGSAATKEKVDEEPAWKKEFSF